MVEITTEQRDETIIASGMGFDIAWQMDHYEGVRENHRLAAMQLAWQLGLPTKGWINGGSPRAGGGRYFLPKGAIENG